MTEPRQTASWDAIRQAVSPPPSSVMAAPKAAPGETGGVQLSADAAPAGSSVPTGGIAPASLGLHGATDATVKAEISAKADEFQGLAAANRHLSQGQQPSGTPGGVPAVDSTVTITRRTRNGTVRTETRTVGWLSQYEQLRPTGSCNRFSAQSSHVDRSYSRNVDQVVGIADSILAELRFLQDGSGLAASSYRSFAHALEVAKAEPGDRHALLSLYGEMLTFVQIARQGGLAEKADFRTFLQDNYDAFANGAAASGGVDALVSTILKDLKVKDVASLQRDKLGMKGAAVTGRFDAQTYFNTQLYVLEQMARNLSRRDGLGMAAMQQSVNDARASIDRIVDLRSNFSDRLKQNTLSPATRSFLSGLGYKLENGALKTTAGAEVADGQLAEMSAQWLEQATFLAQQSHQDVQEAMALHGSYLTSRQRKQVEGWVRAYESFYSDTMTRGTAPTQRTAGTVPAAYSHTATTGPLTAEGGTAPSGPPPEQPDATDAMAVAALEQVAVNEARQPAPDPGTVEAPAEADARRQRGAEVVQKMEQFYADLKRGLSLKGLTEDQRRSVATLHRHGYIRVEGDTVYLTATDSQMREFSQMADTFKNPEGPAAAAILNSVVTAYVRVYTVAALKEDVLGIAMLSSLEGTFLAPEAAAAAQVRGRYPEAEAAAPADPSPTPGEGGGAGSDGDVETPADRPEVRTAMPAGPSASPGTVSLLTDWPDEVHAQREERERRAERKRQEAIEADQAYAEAVQAKGAQEARERRQDAQAIDTRVVRGTDGKTVGVVTTGDGQVIGVSPTVDPGTLTE